MKKLLFSLITLYAMNSFAQTKTFDIVTYFPPSGWKSEQTENAILYSKIDGDKWAQIIIYKNTVSKGSIQTDFESEWKLLVADAYKTTALPEKTAPEKAEGWEVMSGSGLWQYNGSNVATMLTVFSGNNACVSIACNLTAQRFIDDYQNVIGSISLYDGKKVTAGKQLQNMPLQNKTAPKGSFAFTTTTFDDGWVSTIENDWVEVRKGNIKALLHYPKEGTIFPAEPDALTKTAWNILVAPRYSGLSNFKTSYIEDYKRPYFATGYATENSSGQKVFIVLFRRGGGWIEFVSASISDFINEFGFNPESIRWGSITEYTGGWVVDISNGNTVKAEAEIFNKPDLMTTYNKFAVAATDIENTGEWTDNFSSNTFYTSYYTGAYLGMSTYTSSQWFVFKPERNYHWELVATNSFGGQANVGQSKSDGNFQSLNNWQLYFTNIGGSPKTYDVYFSAIKNGRVLWMNDAQHPGSGIFTGFTLKK